MANVTRKGPEILEDSVSTINRAMVGCIMQGFSVHLQTSSNKDQFEFSLKYTIPPKFRALGGVPGAEESYPSYAGPSLLLAPPAPDSWLQGASKCSHMAAGKNAYQNASNNSKMTFSKVE